MPIERAGVTEKFWHVNRPVKIKGIGLDQSGSLPVGKKVKTAQTFEALAEELECATNREAEVLGHCMKLTRRRTWVTAIGVESVWQEKPHSAIWDVYSEVMELRWTTHTLWMSCGIRFASIPLQRYKRATASLRDIQVR